jgi:hypothetical protein
VISRHGIPAWGYDPSEADLWAMVAFVKHLPELTPSTCGEPMAQVSEQQWP